MGYQTMLNGLNEFHRMFNGRRLEFHGEAVKYTQCGSCHQTISPGLWQLEDVSGGPYVIPEGVGDHHMQWVERGPGRNGVLYRVDRIHLDDLETDALPKEEGRVSFTAIVSRDRELNKIEFPGGNGKE